MLCLCVIVDVRCLLLLRCVLLFAVCVRLFGLFAFLVCCAFCRYLFVLLYVALCLVVVVVVCLLAFVCFVGCRVCGCFVLCVV